MMGKIAAEPVVSVFIDLKKKLLENWSLWIEIKIDWSRFSFLTRIAEKLCFFQVAIYTFASGITQYTRQQFFETLICQEFK